ncbi:MAG: hypothetical protein ACI915_003675 [Gammaproteobacteria bacterium]|jgi:hypothetical protein
MAEKGACFCGAIEFEVTGEAQVMGFCHCDDCTKWAGAPISAFSLWPSDGVSVTKGADNIGSFAKTDNSHRKFCKTCGGHVFTDHPGLSMHDVYLNTVPGVAHKPTLHVFYGEKTVAMKDGLPKFKDMPAEFGGSGDTLPD